MWNGIYRHVMISFESGMIVAYITGVNNFSWKGVDIMPFKATFMINDNGETVLPLEANKYLNLRSYDWLKVKIEADSIIIIPPQALDEEAIEGLIHAGILINPR